MTGGPFLMEPAESLLFGPPRSFSAGEAHRIRSQFPPSPLTFQGLIRTRLLRGAQPPLDLDADTAESRAAIAALVGTPSALPAGWQIRGPFPACTLPADVAREGPDAARVVQPWVPTPRFLLGAPGAGGTVRHAREIVSTHPSLSDLGAAAPGGPPPLLGTPDLAATAPAGGWIGPANLRFALDGGRSGWTPRQWAAERPPFVRVEVQPGLARDPDGSARHGMLYFAEALRFAAGSGFLGELQAPLSPPLGAAALTQGVGDAGRRGRLVRFQPVARLDPDWAAVLRGDHLPDTVGDGDRFWLVALAPVRLDGSPALGSPLRPRPRGATIEVLAALTGRAVVLGGMEKATGRPRPNRPYVPAGSAWLFRVRGGTPGSRADSVRALHDRHPLGDPDEAAMGFGHTVVGIAPAGPAASEKEDEA